MPKITLNNNIVNNPESESKYYLLLNPFFYYLGNQSELNSIKE